MFIPFWVLGARSYVINLFPSFVSTSGAWDAFTNGPCIGFILWQDCCPRWSYAFARWYGRGYTFTFPSSNPVVQLGRTVSRASALLHNVHQLEVNLDQSYDGALMKRPKKNADIATLATASTAEDKSRHHQDSQLQQSHLRNPIRQMTQIILKGQKPLLLMVISMKLLQKMS